MYKCKHCDKEFFFEGQLKRHLVFNHPPEPKDSDLYTQIREEVLAGITTATTDASGWDAFTQYIATSPMRSRPTFSYPNITWHTQPEDLSREWTVTLTPTITTA